MRTNKCTNKPRTIHLNGNDYRKTASIYLKASRYTNLFQTRIRHSKAARVAFIKTLSIQIKKEVSEFCKPKYQTLWRSGKKDGNKVFNEFKWTNALEEIKIFRRMLVSAISPRESLSRKCGQKEMSLLPNVGAIIGQIVYAHKTSQDEISPGIDWSVEIYKTCF